VKLSSLAMSYRPRLDQALQRASASAGDDLAEVRVDLSHADRSPYRRVDIFRQGGPAVT
jgi:hypothetical protein